MIVGAVLIVVGVLAVLFRRGLVPYTQRPGFAEPDPRKIAFGWAMFGVLLALLGVVLIIRDVFGPP